MIHFPLINTEAMAKAYRIATRNPKGLDFKEVQLFIEEVGQDIYWHLMSKPIPKAIINELIYARKTGMPTDFNCMSEEVRAGTIQL